MAAESRARKLTMDERGREASIAAAIIKRADREHPADAVLRAELKTNRDLAPEYRRGIAQQVFAYFRWLGWLGDEKDVFRKIERAMGLQQSFNRNPQSVPEAELRDRAVPSWVASAMEVSKDWLVSLQGEPVLWLRARSGRGAELAQKLVGCRARTEAGLRDCLHYGGDQDLFLSPDFHAGEFEVQDLSSQLVGVLCQPRPGETWWDACAGEGGKTLHLADLMQNRGMIWATDRAGWRLDSLKRRAARARIFNYRSRLWDGGPKLPVKTLFDGVLVDAPCSGIGTWQRNPHARWTFLPDELAELATLQGQLLRHVAPAVKKGGRLVYSVCSLARAETTDVADRFEREFPDLEPWPVANPLKPGESTSRHFFWPQEAGGNGMFVALWRKAGDKVPVA